MPVVFRIVAPVALLLTACASAPSPPPSAPEPSPHDAVAAIRAAGARLESALQVHPLRNPAIDGLDREAHRLESAGDFTGAIAAVERALALSPDAPELLQYQAELEIRRGQWLAAEKLAMRSYELGPRLGPLCARNWQTVVEVRIHYDDATTRAHAQKQVAACSIAAPVRM
jgi:tetratricopeptide (TPR) repeat protein